MQTKIALALATTAVAIAALAGPALGVPGYPVSGAWTYDNANDPGPAKTCTGARTMTFDGIMRHDNVGSVAEFRNKSAIQSGAGLYRVVDTFYNGQTWGNVLYTLSLADPDHIQINYVKGGVFTLRRCP
jgi:hypothetical protein